MFDVFDDIYYDILNDMPDDIWWYLKIADIFDDIFDRWLTIFDIIQNYSTIILVYIPAVWEVMDYNFTFHKSFSF